MSPAAFAMIGYFGSDVRRINHALKVHDFSLLIAEAEGLSGAEIELLAAAALLHDIGIHEAERRHQSTAGNWQELEGPPIARTILGGLGFGAAFIERVCFLIGHHHSYGAIDGPDFQILVEADFLVNAFEDQMDGPTIEAVRRRLFRTRAGLDLLDRLYLKGPGENQGERTGPGEGSALAFRLAIPPGS